MCRLKNSKSFTDFITEVNILKYCSAKKLFPKTVFFCSGTFSLHNSASYIHIFVGIHQRLSGMFGLERSSNRFQIIENFICIFTVKYWQFTLDFFKASKRFKNLSFDLSSS